MCVSPGEIKDVQVPDSVPVDLRAKLMVCLIHVHVYTPVEVKRTPEQDSLNFLETENGNKYPSTSPFTHLLTGTCVVADGAESRGDW